jgi:hypothetical protein
LSSGEPAAAPALVRGAEGRGLARQDGERGGDLGENTRKTLYNSPTYIQIIYIHIIYIYNV